MHERGVLEVLHQGGTALDTGIANTAHFLAVKALPLAVVEALHEGDDIDGLRAGNEG